MSDLANTCSLDAFLTRASGCLDRQNRPVAVTTMAEYRPSLPSRTSDYLIRCSRAGSCHHHVPHSSSSATREECIRDVASVDAVEVHSGCEVMSTMIASEHESDRA